MYIQKEHMKDIILNDEHTLGIIKREYVIIDDKDDYTKMEWIDFYDLWVMWRLKKGKENKVKYALDYIVDTEKILNGLGYRMVDCKYYWSGKEQPLIIEFGEYAILLAPRIEKE